MSIKAQGTQLYILDHTDTGNEVIELANLTTIGSSSPTRTKIDVTTLTSAAKEYILGLVEYGSFPCGFVYDPQDASYAKVKTLEGGSAVRIVMGLSDDTTAPVFDTGTTYTLASTRTWIDYNALVEAVDRGEAGVDGAFIGTITLAPSGGETETASS